MTDSQSIPLPPVDMSTLTTSSKPTLCMASSSLQHRTLACDSSANANADSTRKISHQTHCSDSHPKSASIRGGPTWTTSIPSDAYQGVPPSFTSRYPGSSLTADEDEREEKGLEEVGGFVPRNQVFGGESSGKGGVGAGGRKT